MAEVTGSMECSDAPRSRRAGDAGLLVVFAPDLDASPRGFVINGRSHVVGRSPGPGGFELVQPAVSRVHSALLADEAGVRIKDLGSRNGTWVNGRRIEEVLLAPGDAVRIGDALFVFVSDEASVHVCYRHDGTVAPGAAPVTIPSMAGGLAAARLSRDVDAAARTGGSVLVLGETGVGKELVAAGVHDAYGRVGPLVAVNCAALPASLVESELFGYERGAFSGAVRAHEGLVRSAHGGTLFLDEVGDLNLEAQAKLLRVLQSHEVLPLGATRSSPVDVRVVCATHQDLARLLREGRFRADLYARISSFTIRVPPLRERKEDLLLLVRHFLALDGKANLPTSLAFMAKLLTHPWPFNVRELASVVKRAASLATEGELRVDHLPNELTTEPPANVAVAAPPESQDAGGASVPRRPAPTPEALVGALRAHSGNVAAVARALDRDPAQVYRWLKRYALDPDAFR